MIAGGRESELQKEGGRETGGRRETSVIGEGREKNKRTEGE